MMLEVSVGVPLSCGTWVATRRDYKHSASNNSTMIRYTQLSVQDAHAHGYRPTHIEIGKLCFELLVIHLISIVHQFGLHRLHDSQLSCMGVCCLSRPKWLTICSIKVRSVIVCQQFEADFGSLNAGKTVTARVFIVLEAVYSIP